MLERNEIIEFLKKYSEDKEYVYAMWLAMEKYIKKLIELMNIQI